MKQRITKLEKLRVALLSVGLVILFVGFAPQHSFAQTSDDCKKLRDQIKALDTEGNDPLKGLPATCTVNALSYSVIRVFLYAAGGIAVVFIMLGGFQYMMGMSTGGDEAIAKAKKTITYAVIGLVIVVLAGTIVTMLYNLITNNTSSTTTITPPGGPGTGGGGDPGGGTTAAPVTYSVVDKGNNTGGRAYRKIFTVTVTGTQVGVKQLCNNETTGEAVVAVENVFMTSKPFSGGSLVFNNVEADSKAQIGVTLCENDISEK